MYACVRRHDDEAASAPPRAGTPTPAPPTERSHVTARTLRIAIPTETFPPEINGAARFAERLASGLAGRGHDVHVIAPSPTGRPGVSEYEGVTVHRVRAHRWYPHPTWTICLPWETKPAVARLLDAIEPDVVHAQAHFVLGRFGMSEARRRGIPVVSTNHFMPDNVRPYVRAPRRVLDAATGAAWWDLRRTFESTDVITVPTQLAADLLTQNGFTQPIRAISCGIDLSGYGATGEDEDDRRAGDPTVLFVGRLSQEKHIDLIIRALAKSDPGLRLRAHIIGSGDQLPVLKQLAADLGVADRVDFASNVPEAALRRAYARCTFFCMPSTAELQSIATLEAMASSKPVVLANAVALPHLVSEGRNGHLFRPGDVDQLAGIFDRMAGMPEDELAAMGQAGREMARRHDITCTLEAFEGIYTRLVNGESPV
nr:glycosyltransferase [Sediminivirga luteola]